MHVAILAYSLGGASLASTFIVTVLHGLCYTSSKSSSSSSSIELATTCLGCLSCVGLAVLLPLLTKDLKAGTQQWPGWKISTYSIIIVYLFIATGIAAAAVATSHTILAHAQSLFLARCIIWAISAFNQGLFCGLILIHLCNGRSAQLSSELESIRGKTLCPTPSPCPESQRPSLSNDPKMSSDGLTPIQPSASRTSRTSIRYSGRTLFQQDSKRSSLEQVSSGPPDRVESPTEDRERYSGSYDNRKIHRSNSEIKRSLDSVVLLPSPTPSSPGPSLPTSPTASSTNLDMSARPAPPKLKITRDCNIHPLFRSDSPSPPPTPTLGTIVKASPVAGQTITMKTLSRVRSSNSLRVNGPRSRSHSPLFERMDQDKERRRRSCETVGSMPGSILAADVRRSISRYEKKYELHESPHET